MGKFLFHENLYGRNQETIYTHGDFGTTYIHPYNQSRILEHSIENSQRAKTLESGLRSEKKFRLRIQNSRSRRLGLKNSDPNLEASSPSKKLYPYSLLKVIIEKVPS